MRDSGAAALARLARESALRLHDLRLGPEPGDLTIWVDGTRVDDEESHPDTGDPALDRILGASREIVVRPGCRRYRVVFNDYIAFAVRDESYANTEEDEDFSTPFRRYARSSFLRHIAASTFADSVLDVPVRHVALVTLDDVIDVALTGEPLVSSGVLTASDLWLPGAGAD